jgi:hypothetical protein
MRSVPWLFSLGTAVWFGIMAYRARRNWLLWASGGAVFALLTTTIIMGIGEAAFVPVSYEAEVRFRIEVVGMAILTVGFLGWLFTFDLHRRPFALLGWKRQGNRTGKGKHFKVTFHQLTQPESGPKNLPSPARAK